MAISDQAAAASRRGTTLSPDEGVQVAGKGDVIMELFKLLKIAPADSSKGVPTSVEERQMPRAKLGEPDPYKERQQKLAPQMLSEEGQKRFDEAGGVASDAINPPPTIDALDALEPDPAGDLARDARKAMLSERTETGAADTFDAAGAVRATEEERVGSFVRSGGEGLDFNFDRLETGDDVKNLFNEVSEIYADPIEAGKRGVITRGETLEQAEGLLADELGFTRELLRRKTGGMLNAEQATAARILMVRSGERLTELARAIRDGQDDASTLLKFRKQMTIHAGIQMQVRGMKAEIARALGAFNIPASARTAEAQAIAASEMIRQTGGVAEAKKLALGLLDAQRASNNPATTHNYALKGFASKVNGVFQEVYVNGLLSWTYTHIKNFFATPIFMAYQTAEEVLAGVIGGVERGVGKALGAGPQGFTRAGLGSDAEGVYVGQAVARVYGWGRSIKDALITAAETARSETPADSFNKVEGAQLKQIDAENLNASGMAGRFFDVTGKFIRAPGTALLTADDFWRVFAQRGELYSEAYHQAMMARAMGKSDQEALDNAAMSILDPRSYAGQLDEAARYNTLTSDMGKLGEVATMIQRFPVLGRILMPFATAPTNGILRVMERLGVTTDYFKDPVKRQKALARVAFTSGVMYTFAEYAASGRVTGAMPKEENQRNMLPPGWRPYSLVFRGDNWPKDANGDDLPLYNKLTGVPNGELIYISYAGMEPVGAILGIAATTVERQRRTNDPEARISLATNAIGAAAQYFTEMPMIQTIGDIVKSFEKGDISMFAKGPLTSLVPYSAAVRAGERAVNPTQRRPSGDIEYYTLEEVQNPNVVPFGSDGNPQYDLVGLPKGGIGGSVTDAMAKWKSMINDRELMGGASDETSAIQYDVFGKPREMGVRFDTNPVLAMYNLISPFNVRIGKAPNLLERLQMELKGPLRTAKEKESGFAFTDAFQSEWTRQAKSKILVQNPATGDAENFMQALSNLVSSVDFQTMTQQEKFNAMRDVEDRFYESALQVVLSMPQYEDVALAYRDYKTIRDLQKEQGIIRR